jgi:hypothetical protein
MTAPQRLTAKQYLKLHPEKYVMVTHEFGTPIYIAPLKDSKVAITSEKKHAEIWSSLDNTPTKLNYHMAATGYKSLVFEQI